MGNAADMPDLVEDAAAVRVHALGHLAPAFDLVLRIDTWRVLVALALLRNLGRFGDYETGGGALPVILGRERARHHAGRRRAVARHRRLHQAVRQRDRTELEGLEKPGRGHRDSGSCTVTCRWAFLALPRCRQPPVSRRGDGPNGEGEKACESCKGTIGSACRVAVWEEVFPRHCEARSDEAIHISTS